MPTIEQIITAEFDFAAIKELIFKVYTHPTVEGILDKLWGFIDTLPPMMWAIILASIGLVISNFGKKLLMLPVLVGITALGYIGGVIYVAPRLNAMIASILPIGAIDASVLGIVLAAIGAILFLPIYFVGYAGCIGYAAYLFVYPLSATMFGPDMAMLIGLGAAAAVALLAFICRKWVEMAITAVIGSYLAMLAVNVVVLLPGTVNYIIWAVLALEGLIVQVKTRRRY